MVFSVNGAQSIGHDVRIDLSRPYVRMTEHRLDRSQVGATLE